MVKKKFRNILNLLTKKEYFKLNSLRFALTGGFVLSLISLAISLWSFIGCKTCPIILENIYGFLGYEISLLGIFLGMIYSFIDGFILFYIFSWIYNRLINL